MSTESKKIVIKNPDLPTKRDGVETLAGLSPRHSKKQRSTSNEHKGTCRMMMVMMSTLLEFFLTVWLPSQAYLNRLGR